MNTDILPPPQPAELPYVPAGWYLIAWWSLASLCGLGLGLLTTCLIILIALQHVNLGIFLFAILSGGAVVGAVQLPFLNTSRATISGQQWVVASGIGCCLAVGVAFVSEGIIQRIPIGSTTAVTTFAVCLIGPASGFVLGTSQWMVLRRAIQHATLWLLANIVSSSIIWALLLLLAGLAFGGKGD
jgi:hypothetical protein